MASSSSSPQFRPPVCQNCGGIGQERFNGYCCFMCVKSEGASHGPHCRGTDTSIPDPGYTPDRIRWEIKTLKQDVANIKDIALEMREILNMRSQTSSVVPPGFHKQWSKKAVFSIALIAGIISVIKLLKK